ncbi:hypothetical protein [Syntrophothermus lipocalidus]|uniref:Uncharacterized protein n=1 Tax=Syntrophothermus lipocalidus (strain DSM 12680 / TGB-C1) TaxID=643648 RepID=D7CPC7_SYNLT|nr:hypothetical protein [Syntrophothermus lipocalidus]ADI02562.1 hypothetical protein Slip_1807 [Syntrophothermus lipocalidus DSM 12680]
MYEFLHSLLEHVVNVLGTFFAWLGNLLQALFNALKSVLIAIMQPLVAFFTGIAYLLSKCFYIVVLVVQVIFGLFKLIGAVILGVFNTFAQLLSFGGSTDYYYLPDAYRTGWDGVTGFLASTGVHTIAVIMTVFVWLMTAYALIRIAGGDR